MTFVLAMLVFTGGMLVGVSLIGLASANKKPEPGTVANMWRIGYNAGYEDGYDEAVLKWGIKIADLDAEGDKT